jgi:hypothetical protein
MSSRIVRISSFFIALIMLLSCAELPAYAKAIKAPASVSASNNISGVKISWGGVKGAAGYRIYKKTSAKGEWKKLADTKNKSYIDKSIKNKKTYYYSVKAYKGKKRTYSKRSAAAKCYYVAAPKITSAYEGGGNAVIEVNGCPEWYFVYRKTGKNGKYKKLNDSQALLYFDKKKNTSRIEDESVASGKTYYYKIKAAEKGETKLSAYSKEVAVSCKYYAGPCARTGHEKLHKVSVVQPTSVLDGYTLYSCDCGKRICARNITKATGNPAPHENEYAYNESVKRYNASVNYLEAIRKKDKTDLLQVCNGSIEQIRVLKKESDKIVSGCTTDYQKYKAIYNWVHDNVEQDLYTSSFPFEVLRQKRGDCQGDSRLMVDLLRLQNIPCAAIIGYRGDMKTTLTEKNMSSLCGARHQWVMAYVGGRWVFADALWSHFDPSAEELDIPAWYYTIASDYVVVYYNGMNMKMGLGHPTYVNGRYFCFDDNGRQIFSGCGYFADDFSFACDANDCVSQKDKPESFTNYANTENKRPGEVLTGAIYLREAQKKSDENLLHISYYNGRNVRETTYKLGSKIYLSNSTTYTNYSGKYLSMKYGCPVLKVGQTIKLNAEWNYPNTKNTWSSENKSVLTVDQNGNVKAVGEGYAYINFTAKRGSIVLHDGGTFIYVDNSDIYTIKASDMAPESEIKTQRSKIHL